MRFRRLIAIAALVAACVVEPTASAPSDTPTTVAPSPTPTSTAAQMTAAQAIQAEALAYPDDYCGRYLNSGFRDDVPAGAFVSLWRANLETHATAIRARTDGTEPLAFLACMFSYTELLRLADELASADAEAWLATVPAALVAVGPDEVNDRVEMDISSAAPDAPVQVTSHFVALYGLPPGILHVLSDGNGAALRPWGTIRLTVLAPDGRPVHVRNDLYVQWAGDLPNLDCGNGDQAVGISDDGAPTEFPCQAGRWRISVLTHPGGSVAGRGTVTVIGGKSVDLTIKVGVVPPPAP